MRSLILMLIGFMVLPQPAVGEVPPAVREQTVNVVKLKVEGERTKPPKRANPKWGTGFYVSESGFILTAGHVISPLRASENRPKYWDKKSPRITIYTTADDSTGEKAAAIYYDEQVDLGLIKASPKDAHGIKLGSYTELIEMANTDEVYALVFGRDNEDVDIRKGSVDTAVSLGSNGRVKVSIGDVSESDSGSPILNDAGRVVAVLSEGSVDGDIGKTAIPIPFAVPMLARAEVRLAEEEKRINDIQAVIQELKSEASNFNAQLLSAGAGAGWTLSVTFDKMLESGNSPYELTVDIVFGMKNDRQEKLGSFDAQVQPIQARNQAATITNFDKRIVEEIDILNQTRSNNKIKIKDVKNMIVTPKAMWKVATPTGFEEKYKKGQPILLDVDKKTQRAFREN